MIQCNVCYCFYDSKSNYFKTQSVKRESLSWRKKKFFKNISSLSIVPIHSPLYILVNLAILKYNKAATLCTSYKLLSIQYLQQCSRMSKAYRYIHAFTCAHIYTHVRYSFPKNSIRKEKQQNTFIPVIFHGRLPPTLMSHSAARISLSLSHLSRISYERIHANRSVFLPR